MKRKKELSSSIYSFNQTAAGRAGVSGLRGRSTGLGGEEGSSLAFCYCKPCQSCAPGQGQ